MLLSVASSKSVGSASKVRVPLYGKGKEGISSSSSKEKRGGKGLAVC